MRSHEHSYGQGTQPAPRAKDLSDLFLKRHALSVACQIDDATGKIIYKVERTGHDEEESTYTFDRKGHLVRVSQGGYPVEEYAYNAKGQRVGSRRNGRSHSIRYVYDDAGRLLRAGDVRFTYDDKGNLASRQCGIHMTRYVYEETRLMQVLAPYEEPIRYEYDAGAANPVGPIRKFRGNILVMEYLWESLTHLAACVDYERGLEYRFTYDDRLALDRIHLTGIMRHPAYEKRLTPLADRLWPDMESYDPMAQKPSPKTGLQHLFGPQATEVVLLCGCDQIGTPKLFTRYDGRLVKRLRFDSFGNVLHDDMPELPIPVGFAGGLCDPDTGLVRFGYRDYDATTGRFTSPDPLGDTGGDHDLYDYCIDDPVTMNDPAGLIPPLLLFLGAKAAVAGISAMGLYGAAKLSDWMGSRHSGKESTAARDAMKKVAPMTGKIIAGSAAASFAPKVALAAPGAVTATGRRVGAIIQTSKYGDKIVKMAPEIKDFIEASTLSGPPAMTIGGGAGYIAGELYDKKQKK